MQQRQLRLGDILDDYCPRERRVTNHAVVAMVEEAVKRTRCTTCDAEHEYKHAKVPRQRRKNEAIAVASPPAALKRAALDPQPDVEPAAARAAEPDAAPIDGDSDVEPAAAAAQGEPNDESEGAFDDDEPDARDADGDGPIHRRLIRASLPRPEGQQPPARPIPDFTIRQPTGRQNRFRPRHPRGGGAGQSGPHGGHQFGGNRSNGNNMGGPMRGPRPGGGRPGGDRRGPGAGRKRSK